MALGREGMDHVLKYKGIINVWQLVVNRCWYFTSSKYPVVCTEVCVGLGGLRGLSGHRLILVIDNFVKSLYKTSHDVSVV